MLKDGTYAAWFKTPLGQGTGIAHVADGKIWGRDSIMTYSGSCEVDGDRFTASLSIKRHTKDMRRSSGPMTLCFGLRERAPVI
jgi:hypothetical protein